MKKNNKLKISNLTVSSFETALSSKLKKTINGGNLPFSEPPRCEVYEHVGDLTNTACLPGCIGPYQKSKIQRIYFPDGSIGNPGPDMELIIPC